jgi:hypothetical protein
MKRKSDPAQESCPRAFSPGADAAQFRREEAASLLHGQVARRRSVSSSVSSGIVILQGCAPGRTVREWGEAMRLA